MRHLSEIQQHCIKIECGGKVGSGTLYVPKNYSRAYILTVAHNFPVEDDDFAIKIYYGANRQVKEYQLSEYEDECAEGTYRVNCLEGYKPGVDGSPHDGAVIEIPRESWMKDSTYKLGAAGISQELEGLGYPKTGDGRYVEFEGWVLEATDPNENKDYRIRYDFDKYKVPMATDKDFLDGFSGTGLFLQDAGGEELRLSAVFSRDDGETSIIYATDIRRIYELIESMKSGYFLVYPKASYVDYVSLSQRDVECREDYLNTILETVYRNKNDYFRCLCGYTGVGKTYTVNLVKHIYPQFIFEYSWTKLMACLSGKNLKELKDTIYIIDPLEQLLSREERRMLSEQRSSNAGSARLNTDEKLKLYNKIEERSQDLKQYNIHILFIGHNFFWKDVEKRLEDEGRMRLSLKLRNSIIVCHGLEQNKVKEILEKEDIECPEYFYEIPLIMRPQWLHYVMYNREKLPQENDEQYEYEFRLYDETIEWFEKIGNASGGVESFETKELEELDTRLKDYLREDVKFRGNLGLKWEPAYIFLLNTYPFEETDKGFRFTDMILYSYFVARILYEYSRCEKRRDFVLYLMNVQDMAKSNESLRSRIPFFLILFLKQDKSGGAENNVKKWLEEDYTDGYSWIYDKTFMLLRSQEKNSEKEYIYNIKEEKFWERSKQQAQKFESQETSVEEDRKTNGRGYIRIRKNLSIEKEIGE